VMDADNLRDVGGPGERVRMFRDLDPVDPGADVPDPYYGGDAGFEEVLRMVERTSDALVAALDETLRRVPGPS
jgi:protein-tyrosine phosphatase